MSKYAPVVRGIRSAVVIQDMLHEQGLRGTLRMLDFKPDVMPLENEPTPMVRDWRSGVWHSDFSQYHFRWLAHNYDVSVSALLDCLPGRCIPWSLPLTYQERILS